MGEVDVPGNELQRIAQGFDLVLARCVGEEVELDGAAGLGFAHRMIVALAGAVSVGVMEFLEVPWSLILIVLGAQIASAEPIYSNGGSASDQPKPPVTASKIWSLPPNFYHHGI